MMDELLSATLAQLNTIAEAWLDSGASSFSIWRAGQVYRAWGSGSTDHEEMVAMPLKKNDYLFSELRVSGKSLQTAQTRLSADAKLIANLLQVEQNQKNILEELVDTRDQLAILLSISNVTQAVFEIEDLLQVMAAEAIKLVKAEEVFFLLHLNDHEPISVFYPQQSVCLDPLSYTLQDLQAKDQPYIVLGNSNGSSANCQNLLLIPMKVYNAKVAIMGLASREDHEIRSYDIKLARAIADYAGAQIEKIDLLRSNIEMARIDTEIKLAQKIQQSLVVKNMPEVPGLEICSTFQPASRVSGDYYDMIYKPGKSLDFIIGDISGKGMPAALLMAMTMKVIHSVAVMPANPLPDEVINRSNDILYSDYYGSVMFSTLFVGHYDLTTREVVYANAGHSPVVYYPKGGQVAMLRADTVPLGLFPDMQCQLRKLKFSPGDVLVLATDGINETSNKSSRLFGFTQLMGLVERLAERSADEINTGILEAVQAFGAGKSQEDDRAMIIIKAV